MSEGSNQPREGQQAGPPEYAQQPGAAESAEPAQGYEQPYAYGQQPNWNGGYYPPQYVPVKPWEPDPIVALTLAIISLALLMCAAALSSVLTVVEQLRGRYGAVIAFFFIALAAQLALGITAMIMGRKAMKTKPCGKATTAYIFGLSDTCLGGMILLVFLVALIALA